MAETVIVVPCYNEAERLEAGGFIEQLAATRDVDFIFVDDGSSDDTKAVLRRIETAAQGRVSLIEQPRNLGKAEAVRAGMNAAFERAALYVGYFDADLAAPLSEIERLVEVLAGDRRREIVLGARVQLLGRRIGRRRSRHYLGRVFATVASESLELAVYDTQCGAKLFRASDLTRALFAEPFISSWVFDVEIIARLIAAARQGGTPPVEEMIYELPLNCWVDVPGSKVRGFDFVRAVWDVWRIRRRYIVRASRRLAPG